MKDPSISQTSIPRALISPGPNVQPEIEDYTPERIAEFLLNNAVGAEGYAAAREEVRTLGLDPDQIPHEKPAGM